MIKYNVFLQEKISQPLNARKIKSRSCYELWNMDKISSINNVIYWYFTIVFLKNWYKYHSQITFAFIPPSLLLLGKKIKRGKTHYSKNSKCMSDLHASKCKLHGKLFQSTCWEKNIRDNYFHTQLTFEQVHKAIIWWVPDNHEETVNP